jgi:hypothetical protein
LLLTTTNTTGRFAHGSEIQRLVKITLRGAAVAYYADGATWLLAELEGQRRAGGMQALRGDRYAPREVVLRPGKIVAALVAAPVEQHFLHAHATPELRAVFPVHWREAILRPHRCAYADMGGLVAEAGGVSAELARALQVDGLGVEGPRQCHQPV